MKIFLDTNVVVDFCTYREEFFEPVAKIIDLAQSNELELVISSLTFVNVAYIVRKAFGKEKVLTKLLKLSEICKISRIDEEIIKSSIKLNSKDFEDCVQYLSAKSSNAQIIITRNKEDFLNFPITIMSPKEFINACEFTNS